MWRFLPALDLPAVAFHLLGWRRAGQQREMFVQLSPIKAAQGMQHHSSQLVWYRVLFLLSARYCYVNTLRRENISECGSK